MITEQQIDERIRDFRLTSFECRCGGGCDACLKERAIMQRCEIRRLHRELADAQSENARLKLLVVTR